MGNSLLSHYHLQKKCRKYILLCSELILDRTAKDNMVLKQWCLIQDGDNHEGMVKPPAI